MFSLQEWISQFFIFNPKAPFIFTAAVFWVFFGIVLLIDAFIYKNRPWRHAFLFVASIFFYYKTSGFFFLLLLFTITADFFITRQIHRGETPLKRKLWLTLSLCLHLGLLGYFKYAYFFTESFNQLFHTHNKVFNWLAYWANGLAGTDFTVSRIILPIGISFFTFQAISYSVDIYRKQIEPVKRITDYGFFVSFFPQLVAGPIVRASVFIPQLYKEYHLTRAEFGMAVFWILNGLLKKIFLSDYIAVNFIDRVFANPGSSSGFENLAALYGYSLQVYADFSGYTDIAIGVAMLMGFTLTKNFDSPYKAVNVSDFWRRWHISLSTWLRDYLYVPLGGNRGATIATFITVGIITGMITLLSGSWTVLMVCATLILLCVAIAKFKPGTGVWITTNVNLMITMLVGGLWHGASWNFLIWGGLNGAGMIVYKLWKKISPWESKNTWYKRAWAIFLTFSFITFTRVWFRAGSGTTWSDFEATHDISSEFQSALIMLKKVFFEMDWTLAPKVIYEYGLVFSVIAAGMIIHWLPSSFKENYRARFAAFPVWAIVGISFLAVVVAYQVLSAELHPFIYFQF